MVECINCKKKLGILSEKYWFQHAGEEKFWVCKDCKPKVEKEFNTEVEKRRVEAEIIENRRIKANEKWEYKLIQVEVKDQDAFMGLDPRILVDKQLNEMGNKGWELVSAVNIQGRSKSYTVPGSTVGIAFVFKRKI